MASKYKVMVVGMGKRGMHHAAAFKADAAFELAGICDIDPAKIESARAKLGDVNADTDASALARKVKPDVFCFCTLPSLRLPLIKVGIKSGARLIAFEKPIALNSAEAMKIRDLLAKSGVKAVVSHQHRYGEHYRKTKEIIDSGRLGRVHTVYGTAVGWMMHMLTHLIDYMRWYNGEAEAEWVMAQAAGGGKFSDAHPSPDYIAGFIQFANGVRGIAECGVGAPDVPEVDYWWRKCRIGAQGANGFAETLTGAGWRAVVGGETLSGPGCMNYDLDMPPYIREIAQWLDDESRPHQCRFESAYKGFEIAMALCRSALFGGQVPLPLDCGMNELEKLRKKFGAGKALPSCPANAQQYG